MNNTSQFLLRWYNYVNHISIAFNSLRVENDLVDVTLCCDGGKIHAHKMLLSACSNYFKEIFKENPCQHPVIIFRNFKYEDLNAIINFMYHGEVNILQEQLESFLLTAELLEIRGLTDNAEDESSKDQLKIIENTLLDKWISSKSNRPTKLPVPPSTDELPITTILATLPINRDENIPQDNCLISQESGTEVSESQPDMSNIDTTMIKTEESENINDEMQDDTESTSLAEELSEKKSDLRKFRFQLGPKGFKQPKSMTLGKDSHAGKIQCPVCHWSFSQSIDMMSHLQTTHQRKQLTVNRDENIPQDNSLASQESGTDVSESQPDTSNLDTTTIKTEEIEIINDEMQIDTESTSLAEELSDNSNPVSEQTKFRHHHLGPKDFEDPSLTLHKKYMARNKQCPVCNRLFSRPYCMRDHLKRIHQRKQLTINRDENIPRDNPLVSEESGTKVSESAHDISDLNTTTIKTEVTANINYEMQIDTQSTSAESTLDKDLHGGKKQCPVCHRIFSRTYDLRGHLRKIHQSKQITIKEIIYKNNSDSMAKPKRFTHNISHIYTDIKPQ